MNLKKTRNLRELFESDLDSDWDQYLEGVERTAEAAFDLCVRPFLEENGIRFRNGNGEFWMQTDDTIYSTYDIMELEEFMGEIEGGDIILDILNMDVPGVPQARLANYMPCWPEGECS